MDWPSAADYGEAVQNLKHSMGDRELRGGELAVTPLGLPMLWSGGFADVFRIHNASSGNTWALKCFTRRVTGQEDRYRHISAHLNRTRLPFMVDFEYLHQGIRIRGEWFPALKMRWVEGGLRLNDFVEEYLDHPAALRKLLQIWIRMASRLREADIAHADLQHGNVLLVPSSGGRLALRLIDYDGMHVPSLAGAPSAELGHPAYQHPQRGREGIYSFEVDRFSHLAIYSALRCLTVGGEELWERFNNGDNLLFREQDFHDPGNSDVFHALWELPDADSRALVGRLTLACAGPLAETPLLDEIAYGRVSPLTPAEEQAVASVLGAPPPLPDSVVLADGRKLLVAKPLEETPPPEPMSPQLPLNAWVESQLSAERDPPVPLESVGTRWPAEPVYRELPPNRQLGGPPTLAQMLLEKLKLKPSATEKAILRRAPIVLAGVVLLMLLVSIVTSLPKRTRTAASHDSAPGVLVDMPGDITNELGMKFRHIPAGEFMMGTPEIAGAAKPVHRVRITRSFHLGACEVTQDQYERVMGENPSFHKGAFLPADSISWHKAKAFCEALSARDSRYDYRLPTEAEWEYACRAGTTTRYISGDDLDPEYAWFHDNSDGQSHPVGQKRPNAWGLHDVLGNVWEWCEDWHSLHYYAESPVDDPAGPTTGDLRVHRGGSSAALVSGCGSGTRRGASPGVTSGDIGLRVVLVPVE